MDENKVIKLIETMYFEMRIETDHGDKLRMLFDAYHTNEDYYHDLKEKLERKKVI